MEQFHQAVDASRASFRDFLHLAISPTEFLSQPNFVNVADCVIDSDFYCNANLAHFGFNDPKAITVRIPDRDAVVMTRFRDGELQRVLEQCADNSKYHYIIVQTLIGDDGFISHEQLSSLPSNIVRIYSKNVQEPNERLIAIPIGRDWWATQENFDQVFTRAGIETDLDNFIYMNYSIETNHIRKLIYDLLSCEPEVTSCGQYKYREYPLRHSIYAQQMARHALCISPIGRAVDCYRTWEALFVKSVPVIDDNLHSQVYDTLPVIKVADWEKVTVPWLREQYELLQEKTFDLSKLYARYWIKVIRDDANLHF